MKKIMKKFSFVKCLLLFFCLVSFVVFGILCIISRGLMKGQETQQMASRWNTEGGVAQISCFFSVNTNITDEMIEELEHTLDATLVEASITNDSPNENARLWADAYSASGQITIKSNLGEITTDAIGIGGDFFLFHPLQLLSGSYFSGNDVMQDYCVLDQDAAWKLFGSNNVAGQIVTIEGVAHVVTGVVKREESDLHKAAGLDGPLIYVSYSTLVKYGQNHGINHFEIVMPNPVKGYAKSFIEGVITVDEKEKEIIENSSRFNLINRFGQLRKLSTRSMNGKAIIYPYWENVARATEDRLAVLLIFQLIFLILPCIMLFVAFLVWWKRHKWNLKLLFIKGKEILNKRLTKIQSRRIYHKRRRQQKL